MADNVYLNEPSIFHDVPEDHWAIGYICWSYRYGEISGYPDGNFRPNDNLTRAEAVAIINRTISRYLEGNNKMELDPSLVDFSDQSMPFTDVPDDHWVCKQIMAAAVGVPEN